MIIYFFGITLYFIVDKIKNKVINIIIYNTVKKVLWHPSWHEYNKKLLQFNDWIFI